MSGSIEDPPKAASEPALLKRLLTSRTLRSSMRPNRAGQAASEYLIVGVLIALVVLFAIGRFGGSLADRVRCMTLALGAGLSQDSQSPAQVGCGTSPAGNSSPGGPEPVLVQPKLPPAAPPPEPTEEPTPKLPCDAGYTYMLKYGLCLKKLSNGCYDCHSPSF